MLATQNIKRNTAAEAQSGSTGLLVPSLYKEPVYPTERMAESLVKRTNTAPSLSSSEFKMKTKMSHWTPVVHQPSNEQIFIERRDLVVHWFDLWTDSQRKRFLDSIFQRCKKAQLLYTQNWFTDRVPLRKLDFTTALPKFLSLYIFSFLDPKSLSRASAVCWHWKFLCEQDALWSVKCIKHGWFLPYSPSEYEYGAWKKHYIACLKTMDVVPISKGSEVYGTLSDGGNLTSRTLKSKKEKVRESISRNSVGIWGKSPIDNRPAWLDPDRHPGDLEKSFVAMKQAVNPNDPTLPASAYLYSGRWGIPKGRRTGHTRSFTEPSSELKYSFEAGEKRNRHTRALTVEGLGMSSSLSSHLFQENYQDFGEALEQPWEIPAKKPISKRKDLSGGTGLYSLSGTNEETKYLQTFPSHANPRIIFISSKIPASQILVDAVLFGVIPIIYEYDGASLEHLLHNFTAALDGRHAKSVGLFIDGSSEEIHLVKGVKVNLGSLEQGEIKAFWETLTSHTLPPALGGHIDIFLPLAASEDGMEMMLQLENLTGAQVSSPTGLVPSSVNFIKSEWSTSPDGITPPALYFNADKLDSWAGLESLVDEATKVTKKLMTSYFTHQHKDLAEKIAGQIVFEAVGLSKIAQMSKISKDLVDAFTAMDEEEDLQPISFLARYFTAKSEGNYFVKDVYSKEQSQKPEKSNLLNDENENTLFNAKKENEEASSIEEELEEDFEDDFEEDFEEDDSVDNKMLEEQEVSQEPVERMKKLDLEETDVKPDNSFINKSGFMKIMKPNKITEHPDQRTLISTNILNSEINYLRTLCIIRDVYLAPLNASLKSNKAIISYANIQTIFTDVIAILSVTSEVKKSLEARIQQWGPHQCLGDIFIQFTTRLKVYTNFVNNYTVVLNTIEKCREQTPGFRAFLRRYDKKPETKMMSLQELLLVPTRRISEYIELLNALELHTPPDHADRPDLHRSIDKLKELRAFINEHKLRAERESKMIVLQKTIVNCPLLLEGNRYAIKEETVAHLVAPSKLQKDVKPELRIYQHVENFGLFLFNDALVVTICTTKHVPFERSFQKIHKFYASVSLKRIKLDDIPDSKYVKNAFSLTTPKRHWICAAESYEAKFVWIAAFESAVLAIKEAESHSIRSNIL